MTFEPADRRPPELSRTQVASGSSARLGALAVTAVLVVFVGFVLANKPPVPVAPVVGEPTALPTPPQTFSPSSLPFDESEYSFAALVRITGGALRAPLTRQVAESYGGELVIDARDVGKMVHVQVGRQRLDVPTYESFAAWDVELEELLGSDGGQVLLLVEHVPPDLTSTVQGPLAGGYTFTVIGRRDGTRMTLFMEFVYPATSDTLA
jgi:hypothetical protein